MELSIKEELLAQSIGREILIRWKQEGYMETLSQRTESKAIQMMEEIRQILDDTSTTDQECFQRIEAIVNVYESMGVGTVRHDW